MFLAIIMLVGATESVTCFQNTFLDGNSHIIYTKSKYKGDLFPAKYLEPDEAPTMDDFHLFIKSLYRTVYNFNSYPNKTDINTALGLHLMQAVLKRTLIEYGTKLDNTYKNMLEDITEMAENVFTHFQHLYAKTIDWKSAHYRLGVAIRSIVDVSANTIGQFKRNKLKNWLHSDFFMNEYAKRMDEATLDRYDYVYVVQTMEDDIPNIKESNYCLGSVVDTPEPLQPDGPFRPCMESPECLAWLTMTPSTAYSLNHRFLNILMRHLTRRCYLESEAIDEVHMDILCAAIYREAVYIARRGFFARDIFMEHVGFCGYRGHEEVHRVNWFRKIASWVNNDGCVAESDNMIRNLTSVTRRYLYEEHGDGDEVEWHKKLDSFSRSRLSDPCHDHPMAVAVGALAVAVRYTLYQLYSTNNDNSEIS